jgi:homoserine O-acetyltransferase/O-succinyltransferase
MNSSNRSGAARLRRLGAAIATLGLAVGSSESRAQIAANVGNLPTVVSLGTCTLASGATIPDCRVAYRAYGRLNAERSNVVLIPTFFGGRSEDHAFMLGAYVDTTRYRVLIVDALADGHSSSPSNTPGAVRRAFAELTIGDMVESQRRLLVERLGIGHVHAVVGISMGGLQAFEWVVRHPTFADAVVPIVGSPRVLAYDQLIYGALVSEAEHGTRAGLPEDSVWTQLSRLETLFMRTPAAMNDSGPARLATDVASLARAYRSQGWKLDDYAAQMRAIRRQDVTVAFGGDLSRAAEAVRARMLVVYSVDDHIVSASPAAEFARYAGADTLAVRSPCGHSLFWCDSERVGAAVRDFLQRDGRAAAARAGGR